MSIANIIELIGGIGGFIAIIVMALEKRARAQSQERKDEINLFKVQIERLKQLTDRVTCLEKKSDEADETIQQLQTDNIELRGEISKVHSENAQLKAEIKALQIENAALKKEVAVLRDDNAELKLENEVLRDRLDVVEKKRKNNTEPLTK